MSLFLGIRFIEVKKQHNFTFGGQNKNSHSEKVYFIGMVLLLT